MIEYMFTQTRKEPSPTEESTERSIIGRGVEAAVVEVEVDAAVENMMMVDEVVVAVVVVVGKLHRMGMTTLSRQWLDARSKEEGMWSSE